MERNELLPLPLRSQIPIFSPCCMDRAILKSWSRGVTVSGYIVEFNFTVWGSGARGEGVE